MILSDRQMQAGLSGRKDTWIRNIIFGSDRMSEVCLEVENITKSYRGVKAVDSLSFRVERGQILGLIGTNGAGKSTTVSMLATLMKPDSGRILFCGREVSGRAAALRERTGYVPQNIALYESLSGMDNLKFWGRASHVAGRRLKERIAAVSGMTGFSPETLKKRVQEYSGGMKRRLNIAVALLKEPDLLILDEPTAGVDIPSRSVILSAIRKLADNGMAVVYVGHSMDEVERLCDQVCIMHRGKALLNLPMDEALAAPGGKITLEQLYEELLMPDGANPFGKGGDAGEK